MKNSYERQKGKFSYAGRTIYRYDANDSLIMETFYMRNSIFSQELNKYNSGGEVVESIQILQALPALKNEEEISKFNSEKVSYDTVKYLYHYDQFGNMIKSIASDLKGNLHSTNYLLYEHKTLVKGYSLGPNGDTISNTEVERDGDYLKEMMSDRSEGTIHIIWRKNGRIEKHVTYYRGKKEKFKSEYVYDFQGEQIEVLHFR